MKNLTDETVRIDAVKTSCNCASVQPDRFELAPRESIDARFTIDVIAKNADAASRPVRPFAVTAAVVIASPRRQIHTFEITGVARAPAKISPPRVDYGSRVFGSPEAHDQAVLVRTIDSFDLHVEFRDTEPSFEAVVEPTPQLNEFRVTFAPKIQLPFGRFSTMADIQLISRETKTIRQMPVRITGMSLPHVQSVPSDVVMGPQVLGSELTVPMRLESVAGETFCVESYKSLGDGLSLTSLDCSHTVRRWEFTVSQHVLATGRTLNTVELVVRAESYPNSFTIRVPVEYFGFVN